MPIELAYERDRGVRVRSLTMGIPPRTFGALQIKRRESLVTRAVVMPIQQFIHIQGISSVLLLAAAIAALVWANSPWHDSYHHVWEMELTLSQLRLPMHAWINDALMAIFFFLVGMEIKHEIVHGELADMRRAALPIFAAWAAWSFLLCCTALINHGQDSQHGWGIPMATDIAFSLGVLGIMKGVPPELKIFLLTLAIADDIGAIAVIAIFYSGSLDVSALIVGLVLLGLILLCLRLGISQPILYFVLAVGFWVAILQSGIHATIAGVILGFMVPTTAPFSLKEFQEVGSGMVVRFRKALANGDEKAAKNLLGSFEVLVQSTESTSERLTRQLNDWVSFLVLAAVRPGQCGRDFFRRNRPRFTDQPRCLGHLARTGCGQAAWHFGLLEVGGALATGPTSQCRELEADRRGGHAGGHRIHGLDLYQLAGLRKRHVSGRGENGGACGLGHFGHARLLRAAGAGKSSATSGIRGFGWSRLRGQRARETRYNSLVSSIDGTDFLSRTRLCTNLLASLVWTSAGSNC